MSRFILVAIASIVPAAVAAQGSLTGNEDHCQRNFSQCVEFGGDEGRCGSQFNACRANKDRQRQEILEEYSRELREISAAYNLCTSDARDRGADTASNAPDSRTGAAVIIGALAGGAAACTVARDTAEESARVKRDSALSAL